MGLILAAINHLFPSTPWLTITFFSFLSCPLLISPPSLLSALTRLCLSPCTPDFNYNTDGYEGDGAEDGKSQDGSETLPYIDESPTMSPQLCAPQGPDGGTVSPTPAEGLLPGVRTQKDTYWSSFQLRDWRSCYTAVKIIRQMAQQTGQEHKSIEWWARHKLAVCFHLEFQQMLLECPVFAISQDHFHILFKTYAVVFKIIVESSFYFQTHKCIGKTVFSIPV